MGPKTAEFASKLESLIGLLDRYDEKSWQGPVSKCLAEVQKGNFRGVERFLNLFGGSGSCGDLILAPINGHNLREADIESANKALTTLQTEAYDLAGELVRVAIR